MGCFSSKNDINCDFDQQYIKQNESKITTRSTSQIKQIHDSKTEIQNCDSILIEFNTGNKQKFNREDFTFISILGVGTFGKVCLVQNKSTLKYYAMKILKKQKLIKQKAKNQIQTERSILEKMFHPFIVNLCFAFQTERKIYFGTEVVMGGELFSHMKKSQRFSERRAKFYIAQIVLAVEYLHANGIIYRDLKPENILLESDGYIKITDFGLSKEGMIDQQKTYSFCGTPEYLAPEIIFGQGYNFAVDWWSLGILLYEMLSGQSPFTSNTTLGTFKKIINQNIDIKPYFSEQASSLIKGLLDPNPKTRLGGSNQSALEIKQHPFFDNIDWNKLFNKEYTAPYKPEISNPCDIRNFDPVIYLKINLFQEFTSEPIQETLTSYAFNNLKTDNYQNLTYIKHSLIEPLQEQKIESKDWLDEEY